MNIFKEHPAISSIVSFIATASAWWFIFSNKPPAVALWEVTRMFPIPVIIGFFSFVIMVYTLTHVIKRPQFYASRLELENRRGGLKTEIDKHGTRFWAMFAAGYMIEMLTEQQLRKMDRLILGNPESKDGSIERHAKEIGGSTPERVREVIKQATLRARKLGKTEVKWSNERAINILISDPQSTGSRGWVRIEFVMPFFPGPSRPSFIISKRFHPDLFVAIVKAFEDIWNDSETTHPRLDDFHR